MSQPSTISSSARTKIATITSNSPVNLIVGETMTRLHEPPWNSATIRIEVVVFRSGVPTSSAPLRPRGRRRSPRAGGTTRCGWTDVVLRDEGA